MEGSLSHCKLITIAAGATSAITFTGANGSSISCNNFVFSVSDAAASGGLIFTPSGVSQYPVVTLGNGASGTFGYYIDTKNAYEVTLGGGRRAIAGTLFNFSVVPKTVMIQYGIKYLMNPIDKGYNPQI